MHGDTFEAKFQQLCGSAPILPTQYNRTLELIHVLATPGKSVSNATSFLNCQSWEEFPKLVAMVASVSALLSMNDNARRLFWRVLHAPQLQQLIVWNDLKRAITEGQHTSLFLGLTEAATTCSTETIRKIHLPLFSPSENLLAWDYPPGVLNALQRLNPTALTVQLWSAGSIPLQAAYLGLGNLGWTSYTDPDTREAVQNNLDAILGNPQNKFLGFSVGNNSFFDDVPLVSNDIPPPFRTSL